MKHGPAILAFTNPTTNSYKRLVPGFEAPVNLVYSARNRSAACRIPMYSQNPKAKRVEFRCPDPSGNPYLAFAAIVMAGLDGVLDALEKDHKFLLEGDVFTKELIDTWLSYKRETEVDEIRQRPHPHEFFLYYDI